MQERSEKNFCGDGEGKFQEDRRVVDLESIQFKLEQKEGEYQQVYFQKKNN